MFSSDIGKVWLKMKNYQEEDYDQGTPPGLVYIT